MTPNYGGHNSDILRKNDFRKNKNMPTRIFIYINFMFVSVLIVSIQLVFIDD